VVDVVCAADGDVLVAGPTTSSGYLARWAPTGELELRTDLRGIARIFPASDGGYTLYGDGYRATDGSGPFVARYDADDRLLWEVDPGDRPAGAVQGADGPIVLDGARDLPFRALSIDASGAVRTDRIASAPGASYGAFADLAAVSSGDARTTRGGPHADGAWWVGVVTEIPGRRRPDVAHTVFATLSAGRFRDATELHVPGTVSRLDAVDGPEPWIVGRTEAGQGWFGQVRDGRLTRVSRVGEAVTGIEALPDGRLAVLGWTTDRTPRGDVVVPGSGPRAFLWVR
jgi:hypothetical protein